MRLTIHQPQFLPWLGLLSKIKESDKFVILDHVQFEKGYFDNRNRINDGKKDIWLTIPVKTKGKFKSNPLNEVEIADMNFRLKFCQLIMKAYNKTEEDCKHDQFACDMKGMFCNPRRSGKLIEFSLESMKLILDHLAIHTPRYLSSEMNCQNTGSDLILEICQKMGATEYLSGPNGRDYLDLEKFKQAGIKVLFHQWNTEYYLSNLHYMFTIGKEATKKLLETEYEIQEA